MARLPQWLRFGMGAALFALAAASCLSPTLPLPPPEEPSSMTAGADGTWEVRGTCLEGAQVVVVNERTGRGGVYLDRESLGRWVVKIDGNACDVVEATQSLANEESGAVRFVLRETVDGLPVDPAACAP
ncbi:MAG: hypothetical protein JNL21_03675 [Myxococcales bacterium]|nr:hypothetical protein [Myxococcales bacterium]